MDQRCHTFSFGHYHQVPGASCSILYILVLFLVIFMQSLYILSEMVHLLVNIMQVILYHLGVINNPAAIYSSTSIYSLTYKILFADFYQYH